MDEKPEAELDGDSGLELDRIREILVGKEQHELRKLEERIDSIEVEASDVARVLPDAVLLSAQNDTELADALAPTIEGAIQTSVKRDPAVIAEAIYPVIGPAIRKSIREALAGLVVSINQTLEHSLSPRGIRWRLEAARTGRPFAEVVLAHSLVFRVEQVFLIHGETSMLLEHVTAPDVGAQDPEMVTSMLGAIQAFVSDSFGGESEGKIAQVEFGDNVLEVAQGPKAIVACVVRGMVPADLRTRIAETLESIHAERSKDLSAFDGDAAPFVLAQPDLEGLLVEQRAEEETKRNSPFLPLIALILVLLACALFLIRRSSHIERWNRGLERLAAAPGILVLSAERDGTGGEVTGLRDPLSIDPALVLERAGLDPEGVAARWQPFTSLEPEMVELRADRVLAPPKSIRLSLEDGRLILTGSASHSWIQMARAKGAAIAGVDALVSDAVIDEDASQAQLIVETLEGQRLEFPAESAEPFRPPVDQLMGWLRELESIAQESGLFPMIALTGHAGAGERGGLELARRRAEAIQAIFLEDSSRLTWFIETAPQVSPGRGRVTLEVRLLDGPVDER